MKWRSIWYVILASFALILLAVAGAYSAAAAPPSGAAAPNSPDMAFASVQEDFETGSLAASQFVSAVATCVPGGCGWVAVNTASHGGSYAVFAPDVAGVADQQVRLNTALAIPASATSAGLTFWHRYSFETPNFDGGVLETSIDGGTTWLDAGPISPLGATPAPLMRPIATRWPAGRPGSATRATSLPRSRSTCCPMPGKTCGSASGWAATRRSARPVGGLTTSWSATKRPPYAAAVPGLCKPSRRRSGARQW